MRNRASIQTTRPTKPAKFGVKAHGRYINPSYNTSFRPRSHSPFQYTQRSKAKLEKVLNIDSDYLEKDMIDLKEPAEKNQKKNFFRRNRLKRDDAGKPVPYSYHLKDKKRLHFNDLKYSSQDANKFELSSMNSPPETSNLLRMNDPDVERDYEEDLKLKKSELLKSKNLAQLRKLAKRMGGPQNLARHYNMDSREIAQVFPPYVKNKKKVIGARVGNSPSSIIPSSPARVNKPSRSKFRPRVYTFGRKIGEEEKRNQKKIFYPLPEYMRT